MVKKATVPKVKKTTSDKSPVSSVKAQKKSSPVDKVPKPTRSRGEKKDYNIDNILDSSYGSSAGKFESPMLAGTYDGSQDISNWYMSEKLDGVRCIWNGKNLYSRNGNMFYPPKYFTDDFPNTYLDGELFLSRKNFSDTISIVKKQEPHDGWKRIKLLVFDGPKLKGPFSSRLEQLTKIFENNKSPYVALHPHKRLLDKETLEKEMDYICSLDGEGVIVRDPNSAYENRRSATMLKVKRFQDAEAIVTGHVRGTGRCSFGMGALEVINKDGINFKVGSGFNDAQRRKPPKIGSVITYRFFELSKDGVPRFPTFMREHPGF